MQHLKKLLKPAILAIVLLISVQQNSQAQSVDLPPEFQLGIRLGDTFGSDIALDATFAFGGETLHTNVGFNDNLSISALYTFVDTLFDNFYWYYGFGAQVGFFDDFTVAAAAEIGVEYEVQDFPITIGVDYRPAFDIISETDFRSNQIGVNIRYRF